MSFLTPLGLIGGLLAIPIILLYMLRLRRREVTISSTFLWRQVLQDREANSPWQRLRRNLLLLLQSLHHRTGGQHRPDRAAAGRFCQHERHRHQRAFPF